MTFAELDALDLDAWARRLGLDAYDDLERLEASIFGDLLERMKPETEPGDPVRVGPAFARGADASAKSKR